MGWKMGRKVYEFQKYKSDSKITEMCLSFVLKNV